MFNSIFKDFDQFYAGAKYIYTEILSKPIEGKDYKRDKQTIKKADKNVSNGKKILVRPYNGLLYSLLVAAIVPKLAEIDDTHPLKENEIAQLQLMALFCESGKTQEHSGNEYQHPGRVLRSPDQVVIVHVGAVRCASPTGHGMFKVHGYLKQKCVCLNQ